MSRDAWPLLMLMFGSMSIVREVHAQSAPDSAPWTLGADFHASVQPLPVNAIGLFVSRKLAAVGSRGSLEVEIGALSRSKAGPGYACPAVPGAVCNDDRTVSAIGDVLVRARATMGDEAWRPSFSVAVGAYATKLDGYSTRPRIRQPCRRAGHAGRRRSRSETGPYARGRGV